MNTIRIFFLGALFLFCSTSIFAQKIVVTTNYSDAKIYRLSGNTILKPAIGTGSVEIKLDKNSQNRIVIMKDGFEPLVQEFPKKLKWQRSFG